MPKRLGELFVSDDGSRATTPPGWLGDQPNEDAEHSGRNRAEAILKVTGAADAYDSHPKP